MRVSLVLRLTFLLGAGLTLAGPANAQINPFGKTRSNAQLSQSDLAMMNAAAERVYTAKPPVEGASQTWSNPATGAFGKVTLLHAYRGKYRGENYDCRKVQYDVTIKGQYKPGEYVVNWCDVLSEGWKIAP
ncbi:MAG TPA: hypothetical protein VN702_22555 [Acetobacteraceae bacterium]|nr:hypothetical protein [Acetobacteraceae bacterium]